MITEDTTKIQVNIERLKVTKSKRLWILSDYEKKKNFSARWPHRYYIKGRKKEQSISHASFVCQTIGPKPRWLLNMVDWMIKGRPGVKRESALLLAITEAERPTHFVVINYVFIMSYLVGQKTYCYHFGLGSDGNWQNRVVAEVEVNAGMKSWAQNSERGS